jgi:predicted unusual protein kinase regulating ubiquinone biosynthesis (AarF/ABC1/UbiB family)
MSIFKNLDRYKDIAWFLIKYGRSDLVSKIGIEVPSKPEKGDVHSANELKKDLQELGPTFIKFGQLLSTQYDLFPESYQEILSQLQDQAETFPFSDVRKIIKEELGHEIEDIFAEFEPEPFAAASLSQVHMSILPSGRVVVVKVQRPGIGNQMIEDLNILEKLAELIDKNNLLGKNYYCTDKVNSFRKLILDELDFKKEGQTLNRFKHNLKDIEGIVIPAAINDYTTTKVLTMEYISSKKITSLHPIVTMELDGDKLAKSLFDAYLKQLFIDGLVHADPHPGNVYLTDSKEIALLDLGMVEYLSHQTQQDLLQLLLAISEGKGEETCDFLIKMGQPSEEFNEYQYKEDVTDLVTRHQDLTWGQLAIGGLFLKVASYSAKHGLRLTPKFGIFGKVFTNLDMIIRVLAPHFDSNTYIRENIAGLFQRRLLGTFSKETIYRILMNCTELMTKLPYKMNEFLENLSKKEIRIKLQPMDEFRFLSVFEKIANRIALGLVISSLIIGAALMMRVETQFQIWGYPGLAMLLFIGAAMGGIIFITSVLFYDEKKPKK